MDPYDIPGACASIEEFLEILTNWYIRRNRRRFWKSESDADKKDAYDTLYTVLVTLVKTAAPLLPFIAEAMYKNLTGDRSVHLADWPDASELAMNEDVLHRMDAVRRICSLGHGVRNQHRIRVRQPLPEVAVAGRDAHLAVGHEDIIADELNVKVVRFTDDIGEMGHREIVVDAKVLGPRLGPKMKDVMAATRSGDVEVRDDNVLVAAGVEVVPEEYTMRIIARKGHACMSDGGLFACLDLTLTRELELEGLARDVIRVVQNARREADLVPDDRIVLMLKAGGDLAEAIDTHGDLIATEVLAERIVTDALADALYTDSTDIRDQALELAVAVIR